MRFATIQGKLMPKVLLSSSDNTLPISQIEIPLQPAIHESFPFNKALQSMLAGKQLLLEELPFPIEEIQAHYENGFLIFRKGIVIENNKPQCVRCGNQDSHLFSSFPCARCGESCIYCRKCIMMGRVSACSPLISWTGPEPISGEKAESEMKDDSNLQQKREIEQILSMIRGEIDSGEDDVRVQHSSLSSAESVNLHTENATQPDSLLDWRGTMDSDEDTKRQHSSQSLAESIDLHTEISAQSDSLLDWTGTLSSGQQRASDRVVAAIRQSESLLVWAVCGAGKTEVLFQGINKALLEGKRVCIATPRTDVVLELAPRLQKVFPTIPVAVLFGGSKDRHLYAPLTIATTHQLLRFYHAFDTVIVDEVDAFPFSAEETLQYAVEQSRKPTSAMIFLTATPNAALQKECRTGKRNFVTIPARFHRHSLPVPSYAWCGNWRKRLKKGKLPSNILLWLKQRITAEKQALLFFPRIELMEQLLPILKKLHPKIESVHAEDPKRKEKVQAMRNKEIPILLTTTILERGVTFPNLDVAVLGAEDRIFTESALVQIAGRVGRSSDYPSGDITFFHHGKTEAMVKARRQILNMNKEAREKRLIDD